jgi:hypothetical protein
MHAYLLDSSFLNLLAVPIIWFCIFPALFMNFVLSTYQFICFRVYGIQTVKRSDHNSDGPPKHQLPEPDRINCVCCCYFNVLVSFVQKIAARTEQYWCPIKHARKVASIHSRYDKFIEFGNPKAYQEMLEKIRRDFRYLNEPQ